MTAQLMTHSPSTPMWRVATTTTLGAAVLNFAIFGVVDAAGVDFDVPAFGGGPGTMTVSVGHVAVTTLLTMALGWAAAKLASSRRRPTLLSLAVAGGVIALASAVAPLTLDASAGARLTLAVFHLLTGAWFIGGIRLIDLRVADER